MFEWDDEKNALNLAKHGIRFEEALTIFDGIVLTKEDDRWAYGEVREISIGMIDQTFLVATVVHTDRDSAIRIISARRATRREKEEYYGHCARITGQN